MWNYSEANAYPGIILHDCDVSGIKTADGLLSFSFSDGFWMTAHYKQNQYGKVLRTGASEISYCNTEATAFCVYLFEEDRQSGKATREEIPFSELAQQINSSQWELELVDEFYNFGSAIFIGYIISDSFSRPIECQMTLYYKEAIYHWNEIHEDREW